MLATTMDDAKTREQAADLAGLVPGRSGSVFLESEGALVTSRWIAIGEHTISTRDVTSVFVRRNEHRWAGAILIAIGFGMAFFYVPAALAVIGLAVLIAFSGAMRPTLELVIVAKGEKIVAMEATAPSSEDAAAAARLKQVHAALERAIGVSPGKLLPSLTT
jgi:hypothetical protein